jgi:hypothetical protein
MSFNGDLVARGPRTLKDPHAETGDKNKPGAWSSVRRILKAWPGLEQGRNFIGAASNSSLGLTQQLEDTCWESLTRRDRPYAMTLG